LINPPNLLHEQTAVVQVLPKAVHHPAVRARANNLRRIATTKTKKIVGMKLRS
jgi:hypothetical protein